MKRLAVALLSVVFLSAPLAAEAQPDGKAYRVGVLLFSTPLADPNLPAFRQGLRELGYVEGQNITLEYRSAEGRPERLPDLATDLVRLKPNVILAMGGDVAPFVKRATSTLPIVIMSSSDPVLNGLVASLARPGGNVTGVTLIASDLAAKRMQFLKEVAPGVSRVAVLWNPDHPDGEFSQTQAAGRDLGIQVLSLEARRPDDLDTVFQTATRERAEALIVVSSRLVALNRLRITDFALKHRVALVSGWGPWAQAGGLLSYGPDLDVIVRRAATYVDKILKGAKPADLPVEQPTKFELVINMKTAKTLGLTIPQSVLARADEVIQ